MVLRIADPLSMDILMGVEYPLEIHRINEFIQIHLKSLCACLSKVFLSHIGIL